MIIKIPFSEVPQLSARDVDYQSNPQIFEPFLSYLPTLEDLKRAANERKKFPVSRSTLVEEIKGQYAEFVISESQSENIALLESEHTFTIITAHQPALFTGPLYFIYKIFSAINLAEQMNKEMPDHRFVPVFINGSEDHDLNEVNHTSVFGKEITWTTGEKGAVGRMSVAGLDAAIESLSTILGTNERSTAIIDSLRQFSSQSKNYNQFIFLLVNHLFSQYGLIVLTMDSRALKQLFIPQMKREIVEKLSEKIVLDAQTSLGRLGYTPQAHAREINLFYLQDQSRERIVFEDNSYKVLNTDIMFSQEEILLDLEKYPEKYSPNVILRPLFQESILPNIAYIGGGGELAYWVERKNQFKAFGTFFPVLIRRNSAMIVTASQTKIIEKLGLSVNQLFLEENKLINEYVSSSTTFDIHLSEESAEIEKTFARIKFKSGQADPTLIEMVEAEKVKILKQIEQIESRIKRSIKKKEEVSINQITNLKSKLFANGGLQERHENFLQFYTTLGDKFFEVLKENLNPLNKEFLVIMTE